MLSGFPLVAAGEHHCSASRKATRKRTTVTVHHINHKDHSGYFNRTNAHDGDTFILTGKGTGVELNLLSDTTIRFMGNHESTLVSNNGGTTTIYDEGKGTHFIFTSGDGLITIHDFQYDTTGYIQGIWTASKAAPLTASPDGHGGTFLTGPGLKIDLVGDKHVLASQHS
jgi:hypothetical protein